MSLFIFGDFSCKNKSELYNLRDAAKKLGVIFKFGESEIDNCEIMQMLHENESQCKECFSLTTLNQPNNAHELVSPFAMYPLEELFPEGLEGTRAVFNEKCVLSLNKVLHSIELLRNEPEIQELRVFTSDGYADSFEQIECSTNEFFDDMLVQVTKYGSLDPKLYHIC